MTKLEQPLGSLEGLEPLQGCTSSLGRNLYHFLITILGTAPGPVAGVTAELIMRDGVTVGSVPELGAATGCVENLVILQGLCQELQRLQHCQQIQLSGSGTLQSYQCHSRPAPNILPVSQDPAVAQR